jgi:hypothetical protein
LPCQVEVVVKFDPLAGAWRPFHAGILPDTKVSYQVYLLIYCHSGVLP